jgi:hypothetical protein
MRRSGVKFDEVTLLWQRRAKRSSFGQRRTDSARRTLRDATDYLSATSAPACSATTSRDRASVGRVNAGACQASRHQDDDRSADLPNRRAVICRDDCPGHRRPERAIGAGELTQAGTPRGPAITVPEPAFGASLAASDGPSFGARAAPAIPRRGFVALRSEDDSANARKKRRRPAIHTASMADR